MNDKLLTMAFMVTFIAIGINGFLVMGSQFVDQEGNTIPAFTNLTNNAITDLQNESYDINAPTSNSSDAPADAEGFTPITVGGQIAGLQPLQYLEIGVLGIQNVLLWFGGTFPMFVPITTAILVFVTVMQMIAVAYIGSVLVRSIFGRVR